MRRRHLIAAGYSLVAIGPILSIVSGPAAGGSLPTLQSLEATRRRPLFSPTRRPPPPVPVLSPAPVAAPPAAEIAPPPALELSGIVIGADWRLAIAKRPTDNRPIDLRIGSEVDGWTVEEIGERRIVLRRAAQRVVVGLPEPGAVSTEATPDAPDAPQ